MSTINERVKAIMDYKGENPNSLAVKVGVSRQAVTNIVTNGNKPSYDFTESLLTLYPEISPAWLMKGEGEMLNASSGTGAYYTGKNNTATNTVSVGNQAAAEGAEVLFLRERVKELKEELADAKKELAAEKKEYKELLAKYLSK